MVNLKHKVMDHVVFLDAGAQELLNLVNGNKSMIIRGSAVKNAPYGCVREGDVLYFINNNEESEVKARGVVVSVFNSEKLTVEESFETIIRHQDKLQLPDNLFERFAGKSYLVLIGLDDIEEIEPFRIDETSFSNMDGWFPVGKIESVAISQS